MGFLCQLRIDRHPPEPVPVRRHNPDIDMFMAPGDIIVYDPAVSTRKNSPGDAVLAKDVESGTGPFLDKTGATDNCIGNCPCKATEVSDCFCKRVGIVRINVTGNPAIKRCPEIYRDAGIPEIDRVHFAPSLIPAIASSPSISFATISTPVEPTGGITPATAPIKTTLSAKLNGWSFCDWLAFVMGGVIFLGGTPAIRQPFASAITKSPT